MSWDGAGNLTQIEDSLKGKSQYSYNRNHQVIRADYKHKDSHKHVREAFSYSANQNITSHISVSQSIQSGGLTGALSYGGEEAKLILKRVGLCVMVMFIIVIMVMVNL